MSISSHHAVDHSTNAHQPRQGRCQKARAAANVQYLPALRWDHRGQHLQGVGVHVRRAYGGLEADGLRSARQTRWGVHKFGLPDGAEQGEHVCIRAQATVVSAGEGGWVGVG